MTEAGQICAYGCGNPAVRLLRNGAPCCADRFTLCSHYRRRASLRQLGKVNRYAHTQEFKDRQSARMSGSKNPFFGKRLSEEGLRALSAARTGKCVGSLNPNFGKPRSKEVREKISCSRVAKGSAKGSQNPNWRGGVTSPREADMATTRYKRWRSSVFERDNFSCVMCPQRGGDLEADHIKPWAYYPELRYELSNGRTLCVKCHRTTFKDLAKHRAQAAGQPT